MPAKAPLTDDGLDGLVYRVHPLPNTLLSFVFEPLATLSVDLMSRFLVHCEIVTSHVSIARSFFYMYPQALAD